MFAKANQIAKDYTLPIIISYKMYGGECYSGIGTYVIINEEGWFVTACHIIHQIKDFETGEPEMLPIKIPRAKIPPITIGKYLLSNFICRNLLILIGHM